MKRKGMIPDEYDDTDKELQVAFSKGLLKPGLHLQVTKGQVPLNKPKLMKKKLEEIKLDLPWIETLDLTMEPAPLAPELALQLEAHRNKTVDQSNYHEDDLIYNDFEREMKFYRLAQSAVLEGVQRLHQLSVPTKRPTDYLAEMSKSDEHMHKVRQRVQVKENKILRKEKAQKLRDLKKYGKKVQIEKQLQRQKDKRTMMEQLKKYRKGKTKSLDFLDEGPKNIGSEQIIEEKKKFMKEVKEKRAKKDQKYGLKGKMKGWKKNTAKDLDGPVDSAGHDISRKTRKPVQKGNKKRDGKRVRHEARRKMSQVAKRKNKK